MTQDEETQLFDFADLILGIGRLLRPPQDSSPPMCTPVESSVMRFINRHPGTTASSASKATQLPSSNFARVLRALVSKGLVRRETDSKDARSSLLYPTALAQANLVHLRRAWVQALEGAIDDPAIMEATIATLRQIEDNLAARNL